MALMLPAAPNGLPWPRITVVTPSYNQGQYIEATIRSIVSQGYPNLEYLILDGGSTDNSVETIKRFQEHLTYWRTGPDGGHYQAINEGFSQATGDIVAWLNSDDTYFPGTLFYIGEVFAALPEVRWITTLNQGSMNQQGDLSSHAILGASSDGVLSGFHLPGQTRRFHGWIQQESTFFRMDLLQEVSADTAKGLDERFKLAADFDLWMRFSGAATLYSTHRLLGAFRSHSSNRSNALHAYLTEATESFGPLWAADSRRKSLTHLLRDQTMWGRNFPMKRALSRRLAFSGKLITRAVNERLGDLSISDYRYV